MLSGNLAAQLMPWCLVVTLHKRQSHCGLCLGRTQLIPLTSQAPAGFCSRFPQAPTTGCQERERTGDNPGHAPGSQNAAICSAKGQHMPLQPSFRRYNRVLGQMPSRVQREAGGRSEFTLSGLRLVQTAAFAPAPAPFASSCVSSLALVTILRDQLS